MIEDDDLIREAVLTILGSRGFQVKGATNGQEGVNLALEFLPDVILCDVRMPQMDGFAVLRSLRQNSQTNQIPCLLLTAEWNVNLKTFSQQVGANGYLRKPFSTVELLDALQPFLSSSCG